MTDRSKAVERLTTRADSAEGFSSVVTGREIYVPLDDLRTLLTALSAKDAELAKAREALDRLEARNRVGAAWSCKIGVRTPVGLPAGCDAPMRRAVQKAFRDVTGEDAEFTFSGWSARLTDAEMAVVKEPDQ